MADASPSLLPSAARAAQQAHGGPPEARPPARIRRPRKRYSYMDQEPVEPRFHPLGCGNPAKRYRPCDWVTPIVDAMDLFRMKYYGMEMHTQDNDTELPVPEPVEEPVADATASASAGSAPRVTCPGCGTCDPSNFDATTDKDAMVCIACGMVGASIHISQHREKNCAEDEDKTTHAERPYEPSTDEFDRPPPSATEFRQLRDAKSRNLKSAPTWNRDPRVGFAQERVNREAAREARQHDELSTRDQSKQRQIAEKMEDYFLELEPMHQNVKRFCRVSVPNVWKRVVQHCDLCSAGKRCEFAFKQKGAPLIAESILSVTLHNLSTGFVDLQHLEGVEHPHILALNDRFCASKNASNPSAAQRAIRTQIARILSHSGTHPIPSCSADPSLRASPRSSVSDPSMEEVRLQPSSSTEDAVDQETIQMRDSVDKLYRSISATAPKKVHRLALDLVANPQFRTNLDAARGEEGNLLRLPVPTLALLTLAAVSHLLLPPGDLPSFDALQRRFKIADATMADATAALQTLVPPSAVTDSDELDQDLLF